MEFKLVPGENNAAEGWTTATIPMKVYMEAIKGKTSDERDAFLEAWLQTNPSCIARNVA